MALTDFQKQVSVRLNSGEQPEAIATSLAVNLDAVLEAKEAYERDSRENPGPPMPRNWPTGPYSDEELRSLAEWQGTDVETVRATFPGAAIRPSEPPRT
jgi:hypothetical protein